MTIREQVRRIIKVAPFLPLHLFWIFSITFIGVPVIINSVITKWTETVGMPSKHNGIQQRLRNGQVEYFYSIQYIFQVKGEKKEYKLERGFSDESEARRQLKEAMKPTGQISIWHDNSDPMNVTTEKMENLPSQVIPFFIVPQILVLAFIRWYMLKCYEIYFNHSAAARDEYV